MREAEHIALLFYKDFQRDFGARFWCLLEVGDVDYGTATEGGEPGGAEGDQKRYFESSLTARMPSFFL